MDDSAEDDSAEDDWTPGDLVPGDFLDGYLAAAESAGHDLESCPALPTGDGHSGLAAQPG
jgi:hypothetical protein